MVYTSYQTNSYKIIKSTFNTYELPHAPVIFSINFGIFNGQFQCLAGFLLKHEKQNSSPQLKRSYQK